MKLKQLDTIWTGLALGILFPSIMFLIIYYSKFSSNEFFDFLAIAISHNIISSILSLSLVINLGIFFLFYVWKWEMTSRGVVLATLLWGIPIVYFKFLR